MLALEDGSIYAGRSLCRSGRVGRRGGVCDRDDRLSGDHYRSLLLGADGGVYLPHRERVSMMRMVRRVYPHRAVLARRITFDPVTGAHSGRCRTCCAGRCPALDGIDTRSSPETARGRRHARALQHRPDRAAAGQNGADAPDMSLLAPVAQVTSSECHAAGDNSGHLAICGAV